MIVHTAEPLDTAVWLALAEEVEPLFGPMVDDPNFHQVLHKNIARGSAFCIRVMDGPPGTPLVGGLLFSASRAPLYTIGWLAVSGQWRGQGAASALVSHVLKDLTPPSEVKVTTFGQEIAAGRPARRLYERFGFVPAESAARGPEGGSRQVFRLRI